MVRAARVVAASETTRAISLLPVSLNIVLHFGDPMPASLVRRVIPASLAPVARTVRFDDLLETTASCIGVGRGPNDLVVVDPMALVLKEKTLIHWKSARPIVTLVIGEHANDYVFTARSQTAVRDLTWKNGKLTRQLGNALASEAGIDLSVGSTATLYALLAAVGYADDFNSITYALFQTVSPDKS